MQILLHVNNVAKPAELHKVEPPMETDESQIQMAHTITTERIELNLDRTLEMEEKNQMLKMKCMQLEN